MSDQIIGTLQDDKFKELDGSCLVWGYYSLPYMSQFSGVGYSQAQFKMKAIVRAGVFYIPDPSINRPYPEAFPFVKAPCQDVPAHAVHPFN